MIILIKQPLHVITADIKLCVDEGGRGVYSCSIEQLFLSAGNIEHISLRFMMLESPIHSFTDGRRFNSMEYQKYRDTASVIGLFEDSNGEEKRFEKSI